MAFDVASVRAQFPILRRTVRTLDGRDRPLVYLDHGASTHAPQPVIDAVVQTLSHSYANIHRANHTLSVESSDHFDAACETLLDFVGADPTTHCAVLGQNTTMALDVAAHVMADVPGKTLTTLMEHHSNDLPHRARGAVVHADVDDQGRVDLGDVEAKLERGGIKLVAVTGASNVSGYVPPLHKLARLAHDHDARILVDAAQLYAHRPIDVKPASHPEHIDFLAAAGHKAYAPLGSAMLVGPREVLDAASPYMPGGGTVEWVTRKDVGFTKSPDRHMGGTPNIVGAIAFGAATEFLAKIGMTKIQSHEQAMLKHAMKRFAELDDEHGIRLLGPRSPKEKVGVLSFDVPGRRHELVSSILSHEFGIATRNGCFCAQPMLNRLLGLGDDPVWAREIGAGKDVPRPGAVRATIGVYNTEDELDQLCDALDVIGKGAEKGRYKEGTRMCEPIDLPALVPSKKGAKKAR
ncbi:MAG: aminotransferase class V-fold PLP-dependent enzyme [Candidatus Thermoplasmatota archaeon]